MTTERAIPTSRLGRLARVAVAGVRGRRGEAAAEDLAERLGTLRGFAAKLGQMAAYVDGMAPPDAGDGWAVAMGGLFAGAPRSSGDEIRRVVERELGAPIDRLFATWEDEPVASASIGQVHRARLPDGKPVAVKVQHPGVVEAVENDLANIGMLERAAGLLGGRRIETARIVGEIAERVREELDYRAEAAYQARFRVLHAGDPTIRVPAVIADRSTRHVLTTEWAEGRGFDAACAAPEPERAAWCRTLWRFVYRGTVVAGLFNADPHPGNYRFEEDGRVTFLDFGCVQAVEPRRRVADEALHRAALARDDTAFADAVRRLLDLDGGPHEARSIRQLRDMYAPLWSSPFRVTRAYAAGLLHQMRAFAKEAHRSREPVPPLPRGTILMNRLQFGFYSVLARLDAEVDYAAVERAFLG